LTAAAGLTGTTGNFSGAVTAPNFVGSAATLTHILDGTLNHVAYATGTGGSNTGITSYADFIYDPVNYNLAIGGANQTGATSVIAIGQNAGAGQASTSGAIAMGTNSGAFQATDAIAIGTSAGAKQALFSVALGTNAGADQTSATSAIAIGTNAGANQNQPSTIAIGTGSGASQTASSVVAIGTGAGASQTNINAIAIGTGAGASQINPNVIAIGTGAGARQDADNAIAIGTAAGASQTASSIILNAGGAAGATSDGGIAGLFVSPVRADTTLTNNYIQYNTATREIIYNSANDVLIPKTAFNITIDTAAVPNGGPTTTIQTTTVSPTVAAYISVQVTVDVTTSSASILDLTILVNGSSGDTFQNSIAAGGAHHTISLIHRTAATVAPGAIPIVVRGNNSAGTATVQNIATLITYHVS
jgi:hypothetical protein